MKMKITLEPYSGGTYTAACDAEHVSDVVRMFKGLLVQTGYHPETVDGLFSDEELWFPEEGDFEKLLNEKRDNGNKMCTD